MIGVTVTQDGQSAQVRFSPPPEQWRFANGYDLKRFQLDIRQRCRPFQYELLTSEVLNEIEATMRSLVANLQQRGWLLTS